MVYSSCTSTKLLIDREINQENLSSQLNNGDQIKVTTIENKVLRMNISSFENTYIAGHEGSKIETVQYAQIDVIELKKVDGVKTALGLLVVGVVILLIVTLSPNSINP